MRSILIKVVSISGHYHLFHIIKIIFIYSLCGGIIKYGVIRIIQPFIYSIISYSIVTNNIISWFWCVRNAETWFMIESKQNYQGPFELTDFWV
jgi:hypothetical protein